MCCAASAMAARIEEAGFRLRAAWRTPSETACRDGPAVPRISRSHGNAAGNSGAHEFSLDQIAYEYPDEPVPPGLTPDAHLADLVRAGAAARYPAGVPDKVARLLDERIAAHRSARLCPLFPDRARHRPFRAGAEHFVPGARLGGQFRGLLRAWRHRGRSRRRVDLLFERFISAERANRPISTWISSMSGARR